MNPIISKPAAVWLFDLDGTLVDTAADLADALNELRKQHGRDALPYERIRPTVSHGTVAMLKLAFDINPDDDGFPALRTEFLSIYANDLGLSSKLFPGCQGVLDELSAQGLRWGIVTNKPGHLTRPLMERMNIYPAPDCIVSADETAASKPHPASLLLACKQLAVSPTDCVYVGDADRDIVAARRAGMPSIAAGWGYLDVGDDISQWQATHIATNPDDLLKHISKR